MMKTSNKEMRKALWSTFWRSFAANAPWELTRQEATGYAFSMVPSPRVRQILILILILLTTLR